MTSDRRFEASVILVSYNTRDSLCACLDSLYAAIGSRSIQVIVVDNNSRDGSADMVARRFPQVELIRSRTNLGFAAGNNVGFKRAYGRYVILLNPDTLLHKAAIDNAIANMDANPAAGLAGGRLLGRSGADEPSARLFPSLLNEVLVLSGLAARFPRSRFMGRFDRTWADPSEAASVDWVPGAFTVIRANALVKVGVFDERYFLYYEEVDLCRRFKEAGWQVWYWPDIVIRHWGGESAKTVEREDFTSSGSQLVLWRMRSALLFYRKHHGALTTWAVAMFEISWHSLRRLKAVCGHAPQAKADESRRIARLMRRAWRETLGGRSSPARPW